MDQYLLIITYVFIVVFPAATLFSALVAFSKIRFLRQDFEILRQDFKVLASAHNTHNGKRTGEPNGE